MTLHSAAFPADTFRVLEARGTEGLNRPYAFDLLLEGRTRDLPVEAFLLQPATLSMVGPGCALVRHGVLGAMEELDDREGRPAFRARLVARLWTLSLDRRPRVLPGRSLPAILGALLASSGIPCDLEGLDPGGGPPLEFACQYGESSLAFLDRWCARLGILYAFRQEAMAERVVFLEDPRSLPGRPGVLPYGPSPGESLASLASRILPGQEGGRAFRGEGAFPSLQAGHRFTLDGHPRAAWNREHRVLALEHEASPLRLVQRMEAVPGDAPCRPPCPAPWPRIEGSLPACLDPGALPGEDGRIPVRLPFDPLAPPVRVPMLQPSGGEGSGLLARLAPGARMLLSFLEGDPDRPVISGALPPPEQAPARPGALSLRTATDDALDLGHLEDGSLSLETAGHLELRAASASRVTRDHRMDLGAGSEARILLGSSLDLVAGNRAHSAFGARLQSTFAPSMSLDMGRHVHYGKGQRTSFSHQGTNLGYFWYAGCVPRSREVMALNLRVGALAFTQGLLQGGATVVADRLAGGVPPPGEAGGFLAGTLALSAGFALHLQLALHTLKGVPKTALLQAANHARGTLVQGLPVGAWINDGTLTLGVGEVQVPAIYQRETRPAQFLRDLGDPYRGPLPARIAGFSFNGGNFEYRSNFAHSLRVASSKGILLETRLRQEAGERRNAFLSRRGQGPRAEYAFRISAGFGHILEMVPPPMDPGNPVTRHFLSLDAQGGFRVAGASIPPGEQTPRFHAGLAVYGRYAGLAHTWYRQLPAAGGPTPPIAFQAGLLLLQQGGLMLGMDKNEGYHQVRMVKVSNPAGKVALEAEMIHAQAGRLTLEVASGMRLLGPGCALEGGAREGCLTLVADGRIVLGG